MQKIALIVSLGTLAILMASCESLPWFNTTENQEKTEEPTEPTVSPSPEEANKQDFPNPTEPSQPKASTTVTGLIPWTNPENRIKEIAKGRQDPFALVVPQIQEIKLEQPDNGGTNRTVPPVTPIPLPSPVPRSTIVGNQSSPDKSSNGNGTLILTPPNSSPSTPKISQPEFIPDLPIIPQPVLAQQVSVTGVIQVNGVTQAIIKAPNEKFSRYVKAGQYISNGEVLVKRIEVNSGPTPVIVLEQFGKEVSKRVGEKPEAGIDKVELNKSEDILS